VDGLTTQLAQNVQQLKNVSSPYGYTGAIVTFVDDDAESYFLTNLKPTFDAKGVKCNIAVISNNVGTINYMSVQDLLNLQSQGYEIVSHSKTHSSSIFRDNIANTTDAMLDIEFGDSQKWLKDNGFGDVNIIIYPYGYFGTYASKIKNIARKYFRNGVDAGGTYNTSPSDNMLLGRIFLDKTKDISTFTASIDQAIANNAWLIFGSHGYDTNQIDGAYLGQIIDYIKSKNIPILTFSDAEKLKGNAVSYGEYTDTTKGMFIGKDGAVKLNGINGSLNIIKLAYTGTMDDAISLFPANKVTICEISGAKDTLNATGGVLTVYNLDAYYQYEIFAAADGKKMFTRNWNPSGSRWNNWYEIITTDSLDTKQALKIVKSAYTGTMDDPITAYDQYKETVVEITAAKDTILSTGGVMKVFRGDPYYCYALFYPTNSDTSAIYKRVWNDGANAWFSWKQV
jgi:hypothetical protein